MREGCLALALVAASLSTAHAGDAPDAKALFERASADYNLGRFHAAALGYEEVYRLHPDSVLLYNIAQAYRLAGDAEKALFFYRNYLRNKPDAENREQIKQRIADLEQVVATQKKPPNETTPVAPIALPTGSQVAPAPSGGALVVQHEPPRRQPLYKKWWLWTIVGGVAAGAAVGIALGVTSQPAPFRANLPEAGPGLR
jgi:tetratricopeptide (TPR) repeat protein